MNQVQTSQIGFCTDC